MWRKTSVKISCAQMDRRWERDLKSSVPRSPAGWGGVPAAPITPPLWGGCDSAGVQPQRVSGSPKDGQCRQRTRDQTPSSMPENGQPLWVWPNSKSLIKLYFYRDLLYNINGTGAWHDFSSRKSLYRNTREMYRKFYRFVHTKQKLFDQEGCQSDNHK